MRRMTESEVSRHLGGPWQAVLSISRVDRGPLAVPMSYHYRDGEFVMITSPDSDHGRLMLARGRASMTIHHDVVSARKVEQWYVTAEGPIWFTDQDPEPVLRAIMAKDRGAENAEAWVTQSLPQATTVAVLVPERISGFHGTSVLD